MSIITKIYLDMDGVICDFMGSYTSFCNLNENEIKPFRNMKDKWKYWEPFIESNGFENLGWHPGGKKLLEFLYGTRIPVEILSSSGGITHHDKVMDQKISWLTRAGIPFKPNIVPGRKNKKNFATPDSLLIDDTDDVIESFIEAGGHAILHKSAEDTIEQLKTKLYRWDGIIE